MRHIAAVGFCASLMVLDAHAQSSPQYVSRRAEITQAQLRAAEADLASATHDIQRAKALVATGDVLADTQDIQHIPAAKTYYERSLERSTALPVEGPGYLAIARRRLAQ